jgi:PadR family transcriptional regulator PadR
VACAERPRYGYELARTLGEAGLVPGRVSPGRLYETLARLSRQGALVATDEPGERGPGRRRYRVSDMGLELLERWVDSLERTGAAVATVLAAAARLAASGALAGPGGIRGPEPQPTGPEPPPAGPEPQPTGPEPPPAGPTRGPLSRAATKEGGETMSCHCHCGGPSWGRFGRAGRFAEDEFPGGPPQRARSVEERLDAIERLLEQLRPPAST